MALQRILFMLLLAMATGQKITREPSDFDVTTLVVTTAPVVSYSAVVYWKIQEPLRRIELAYGQSLSFVWDDDFAHGVVDATTYYPYCPTTGAGVSGHICLIEFENLQILPGFSGLIYLICPIHTGMMQEIYVSAPPSTKVPESSGDLEATTADETCLKCAPSPVASTLQNAEEENGGVTAAPMPSSSPFASTSEIQIDGPTPPPSPSPVPSTLQNAEEENGGVTSLSVTREHISTTAPVLDTAVPPAPVTTKISTPVLTQQTPAPVPVPTQPTPPPPTPAPRVTCIVSEFGEFGNCSVQCGGGIRTKTRSIIFAEAGVLGGSSSGLSCPALKEDEVCNVSPCPTIAHPAATNCVVSAFGLFMRCSVDCGGGTQLRTRTILTQPSVGGIQCPTLFDVQTCNNEPCTTVTTGVVTTKTATTRTTSTRSTTVAPSQATTTTTESAPITDMKPAIRTAIVQTTVYVPFTCSTATACPSRDICSSVSCFDGQCFYGFSSNGTVCLQMGMVGKCDGLSSLGCKDLKLPTSSMTTTETTTIVVTSSSTSTVSTAIIYNAITASTNTIAATTLPPPRALSVCTALDDRKQCIPIDKPCYVGTCQTFTAGVPKCWALTGNDYFYNGACPLPASSGGGIGACSLGKCVIPTTPTTMQTTPFTKVITTTTTTRELIPVSNCIGAVFDSICLFSPCVKSTCSLGSCGLSPGSSRVNFVDGSTCFDGTRQGKCRQETCIIDVTTPTIPISTAVATTVSQLQDIACLNKNLGSLCPKPICHLPGFCVAGVCQEAGFVSDNSLCAYISGQSSSGKCVNGVCKMIVSTTTSLLVTSTTRTPSITQTMVPNGLSLNDVAAEGVAFFDVSILMTSISLDDFWTLIEFQRMLLNILQGAPYSFSQIEVKVVSVLETEDPSLSISVRIVASGDSAVIVDVLQRIKISFGKNAVNILGALLGQLRTEYSDIFDQTATLTLLSIKSIQEAPRIPAASGATKGLDPATQSAIAVPICIVIVVIIIVFVLYRKKQKAKSGNVYDKSRFHGLDLDATNLNLELGSLSARKRDAKSFSEASHGLTKDNFFHSKLPENKEKNRYVDVLPYDSTRVKLFPIPGVAGSDYINANFIHGFEEDSWFIATQGPKENTASDFWRMVWEHRVEVIAMLTKIKENGSVKCFMYWPDEMDSKKFGDIEVKKIVVTDGNDYVMRSFRIKHIPSNTVREVHHFQYLAWPDHNVPVDTSSFLNFLMEVRKAQKSSVPAIIHCSAGVGRAGTFIVMSHQVKRYEATGQIDIAEDVASVRRERPMMVQTASQYVFIHQSLVDFIISQPPVPPPHMDSTALDFLHHFRSTRFSQFDVGINGRQIIFVGEIVLLSGKKHSKKSTAKIVICNDVVIVCAIEGSFYELLANPAERASVSVVKNDKFNVNGTERFVFDFMQKDIALLFEVNNAVERKQWMQRLTDRSNYIPTDKLRGPRLVPLSRLNREAVIKYLNLPDPFTSQGVAALEQEYKRIPTIFKMTASEEFVPVGVQAPNGIMVSNPLYYTKSPEENSAYPVESSFPYKPYDVPQFKITSPMPLTSSHYLNAVHDVQDSWVDELKYELETVVDGPGSPAVMNTSLPFVSLMDENVDVDYESSDDNDEVFYSQSSPPNFSQQRKSLYTDRQVRNSLMHESDMNDYPGMIVPMHYPTNSVAPVSQVSAPRSSKRSGSFSRSGSDSGFNRTERGSVVVHMGAEFPLAAPKAPHVPVRRIFHLSSAKDIETAVPKGSRALGGPLGGYSSFTAAEIKLPPGVSRGVPLTMIVGRDPPSSVARSVSFQRVSASVPAETTKGSYYDMAPVQSPMRARQLSKSKKEKSLASPKALEASEESDAEDTTQPLEQIQVLKHGRCSFLGNCTCPNCT